MNKKYFLSLFLFVSVSCFAVHPAECTAVTLRDATEPDSLCPRVEVVLSYGSHANPPVYVQGEQLPTHDTAIQVLRKVSEQFQLRGLYLIDILAYINGDLDAITLKIE